MKEIKHRLVLFAYLCSIGLFFSLVLYINNYVIRREDVLICFALLLLVSNLFILFLIMEFEAYRIAKLIIENKIMHIAVASIMQKSYDESSFTLIGGFEVFISCFGVLLGSRVIKFNIDGVELKKVEIGKNFIYIAYGTSKRIRTIKLLHCGVDKSELQDILEGFRYETGVIPVVLDNIT